ncbi:MAG: FmdB family zinc ribbon protein [Actinomycetota bacterium]
MPTYEYECKSCKRAVEVQHGINDPAPATCDNCGGELRRIFYPPGLVFKGTGFYSTEGRFGRTAEERSTFKQDEGKSDAPDGRKDGRTDTAPTTKAEPKTSAGTEKSA